MKWPTNRQPHSNRFNSAIYREDRAYTFQRRDSSEVVELDGDPDETSMTLNVELVSVYIYIYVYIHHPSNGFVLLFLCDQIVS